MDTIPSLLDRFRDFELYLKNFWNFGPHLKELARVDAELALGRGQEVLDGANDGAGLHVGKSSVQRSIIITGPG